MHQCFEKELKFKSFGWLSRYIFLYRYIDILKILNKLPIKWLMLFVIQLPPFVSFPPLPRPPSSQLFQPVSSWMPVFWWVCRCRIFCSTTASPVEPIVWWRPYNRRPATCRRPTVELVLGLRRNCDDWCYEILYAKCLQIWVGVGLCRAVQRLRRVLGKFAWGDSKLVVGIPLIRGSIESPH